MMVLDYLSGCVASAKEALENPNDTNKGLTSKKGALGIIKKVSYLFVIVVGVAIDWIIFELANQIGVSVATGTFFGILTTSWFILNELLSLTENAGRMGAPVPKFIKNIVAVLKDKVEDSGESIVEAVEEFVE
jgi:toxin secretion/phage lysis holin